MIGATVFLVLVMLLVGKMVWDVQIAKVKRFINELERFQVLAGIKPNDKKKDRKDLSADFTGVDIEGIEQLAERFQKLAHIKEDKQ